ncbi:TOMM precursor leader peptide-binding protein, partial [Actinokineospora sp.]|uniref:TOMM precursor leader peptide-binding protein n=1 Tax=Actinokineospora sp. TaxID=1872133 RepID=UPI003D6C1AEE
DVGAGFTAEDVGRERAAAARDAIQRVDPAVRDTRAQPDLALLTDALVPDPAVVARLVEQGIPHLPIRVRDGVGIVGPLVIPAATACLTCADLHRTDYDKCWPIIAAQLAGRPQLADLAAVHATAGLAAAQVLAALRWLASPGPHPPAVCTRSLEIDPVDATIAHREWPPHPHCACGAAPVRERG